MADRSDITPELLRQLLRYEPETGKLFWCERSEEIWRESGSADPFAAALHWIAKNAGKEAGSVSRTGYIRTTVLGASLLGHRIAWAIHYDKWPQKHIDHINGDRADNRIANLREVTNAINCQNKRKPLPKNKTGLLGVTFQAGAYRAAVMVNRKQHHLGRFKTAEEAHAAYVEAKRRMHEGCTL